MGAADTVTKAYMRENTIFADAFNYLIYGGRRVIDPNSLKELDTTEIALPFGADAWDGPLSLHEMMSVDKPEIMQMVPDYRIQLIDPARMKPEDLMKFETSLREVMGYIKYSKDKEGMKTYMAGNSRTMLERTAAQVIKAITNTPIEIPEGLEEVNVCEAIEEMMKDSKAEGKLDAFAGLVKDGLLSVKDAAARLNMTEEEFEAAIKKLV